jgi:hypothetical protein
MTQFLITGPGRSGTQMVRKALQHHSEIQCLGEIFQPHDFRSRYIPEGKSNMGEILDECSAAAVKKVFGLTVLYNEVFASPYTKGLTDELVKRRFKVIHVVRENLLRRYVSNHVAHTTKIWMVAGQPRPTTLRATVSCARLYIDMVRTAARAQRLRGRFRELPILELTYEDFCGDFSGNIRRACEFLSVPYEHLPPRTIKQESRPLREAIANYDWLKLLFALSRYRRFFDE